MPLAALCCIAQMQWDDSPRLQHLLLVCVEKFAISQVLEVFASQSLGGGALLSRMREKAVTRLNGMHLPANLCGILTHFRVNVNTGMY